MANYIATLRGTLGSGTSVDEFSHSLGIISASEPSVIANSMAVHWRTVWDSGATNLASFFEPTTSYTEVTVAEILNLAGTPAPAVSVAYHIPFTPPLVGIAITGSVPMQNAIAVSYWGCCYENGAPIKARFYLPSPTRFFVDTVTGLLSTDGRSLVSNAIETFFSSLSADGHSPAVWSRGGKKGPPQMRLADRLRVGDKIDTIRRRRNASAEAYTDVQL